MARGVSPYGDGFAAHRIISACARALGIERLARSTTGNVA
jgi:hypothetical protein